MAIRYQVLGRPEDDNALHVEIDSGQSIQRLLFDCGERCLETLSFGQIQQMDQVFFSHFHMDHISGFDSLFRCLYSRENPVVFWGPENAAEILQHRFQGFWWNLVDDQTGSVLVKSIGPEFVSTSRFELSERFAQCHPIEKVPRPETLYQSDSFEIRSIQLEHQGPSMGYRINEQPKQNIRNEKMEAMNLKPGPWIRDLKSDRQGKIQIEGREFERDELRTKLIQNTTGESIAYLTDFVLDSETEKRLIDFLDGCDTVVCEAQYCQADFELAKRNFHTTTDQVSRLAAKSNIGTLILFHLSDRYPKVEWTQMLRQAQSNFPNTKFAPGWLPDLQH